MRRRQYLRTTALATGVGVVAGCSGADARTDNEPAATVTLRNLDFEPITVAVAPGETVEWVNEGLLWGAKAYLHSAGADWSFEAVLSDTQTATHTFETDGVYHYVVDIDGTGPKCGAVVVGGASLEGRPSCK